MGENKEKNDVTKKGKLLNKINPFDEGTPRHYIINTIGSIIMVVLFVLVMLNLRSSVLEFDELSLKNEARIIELQAELDKLGETKEYNEEVAREVSHSASVLGKEIAKYQTDYKLHVLRNSDEEIEKVVEELSKYFTKDSQDARVPWFVPTKGDVNGEWTFENNYKFSTSSLDVVWTYRLKEGGGADITEVLAYAKGVYLPDEELFTDIDWVITGAGNRYVDFTETETEQSEALQKVIEEIREADGKKNKTTTDNSNDEDNTSDDDENLIDMLEDQPGVFEQTDEEREALIRAREEHKRKQTGGGGND